MLLLLVLWSVISFLVITRFVVSSVEIVGHSMSPTLEPGQRHILSRWVHHLLGFERGDVVVIKDGVGYSIKRIIALPNEQIELSDGTVLVNGARLAEPYLPKNTRTDYGALGPGTYVVAPDCYFVMGDNRGRSHDSRHFGAVHRSKLLGQLSL